jgi:hypothetical protein
MRPESHLLNKLSEKVLTSLLLSCDMKKEPVKACSLCVM